MTACHRTKIWKYEDIKILASFATHFFFSQLSFKHSFTTDGRYYRPSSGHSRFVPLSKNGCWLIAGVISPSGNLRFSTNLKSVSSFPLPTRGLKRVFPWLWTIIWFYSLLACGLETEHVSISFYCLSVVANVFCSFFPKQKLYFKITFSFREPLTSKLPDKPWGPQN